MAGLWTAAPLHAGLGCGIGVFTLAASSGTENDTRPAKQACREPKVFGHGGGRANAFLTCAAGRRAQSEKRRGRALLGVSVHTVTYDELVSDTAVRWRPFRFPRRRPNVTAVRLRYPKPEGWRLSARLTPTVIGGGGLGTSKPRPATATSLPGRRDLLGPRAAPSAPASAASSSSSTPRHPSATSSRTTALKTSTCTPRLSMRCRAASCRPETR